MAVVKCVYIPRMGSIQRKEIRLSSFGEFMSDVVQGWLIEISVNQFRRTHRFYLNDRPVLPGEPSNKLLHNSEIVIVEG